MPATLVNSAAGTAAKSFSFAQRQLRFFKIAMQDVSNVAISLAGEFGVDGGIDNQYGLVQQVIQVLQNYGTIEHMRVGASGTGSDGFIYAALDVGGSAEADGATWVPRLAGGSATTLPAAIQADIRVLRKHTDNTAQPQALGAAGTAGVGGLDVTGSDVTETGLVLT